MRRYGPLDWHGHVHCLNPDCGYCWERRGTTEALNVDRYAAAHARTGHGVSSQLHRTDWCLELGCRVDVAPKVPAGA